MNKLSFIDKLKILLDVSKSSNLYIVVLILLVFIGITLLTTNKKNASRNRIIYSIIVLFVIIFVGVSYYDSLGKMLKYMMDNFFIAAFFPNLAVYLAALIATNIILWISIFSFKSSKLIRVLNVVVFIIMNYLLMLILNIVKNESLDIFNQTSVYENKSASALISLSSTLFIVWIIFLVIYKLFLIYLRKDYKPKVRRVIIKKKVKKLPENFSPKEIPSRIYGKAPSKPIKINNPETAELEKMLTLDDYKLLLKMLNEQKQKEKEAQEKVKIEQEELKKYNELLNLYKMQ